MKKIFLPLLLLIILSGCSKQKGENMTIELSGNATTGYTWSYLIENDDIIELSKEDFIKDNLDDSVVGSGGTYIYTFTGKKEGTTQITFTYKRSWEEEKLYNITYEVSIDKNKKITLNNLTGNYDKELPKPIFK